LDYILVPRRNLKGGKRIGSAVSSRTIQIGDAYRRHIKEYLLQYEVEYGIAPVGSSPLFYSRRTGSAVAARTINDALKKIFVDAGIADARDHTLASHSLRKTFAERVYEASGDNLVLTKSAMNHVSADSTLRYINPNRTVVADLQRGVGDALLDGPSMEVE
jgi:integrase